MLSVHSYCILIVCFFSLAKPVRTFCPESLHVVASVTLRPLTTTKPTVSLLNRQLSGKKKQNDKAPARFDINQSINTDEPISVHLRHTLTALATIVRCESVAFTGRLSVLIIQRNRLNCTHPPVRLKNLKSIKCKGRKRLSALPPPPHTCCYCWHWW